MVSEKQVMDKLATVIDPELNLNVVDLGLIYEVDIDGTHVTVIMTLTSPGCPLAPMIEGQAKEAVLSLDGIDMVDVSIVFDPPWNPSMMSDEAKLELGFGI
jgi:metal-sulfur cluster biosynthetic enzyme